MTGDGFAEEVIHDGEILPAAEILLVTLIYLEPQLEPTADEGLDPQLVIQECFKFLEFIADGKYARYVSEKAEGTSWKVHN